MHTNSVAIFRKIVLPLFRSGIRVLEVGGRAAIRDYQEAAQEQGYTGLAWTLCDLSNADFGQAAVVEMIDEESIGSADNIYDVVLSGQTIEHVKRPWLWVPELARVCRPGAFWPSSPRFPGATTGRRSTAGDSSRTA